MFRRGLRLVPVGRYGSGYQSYLLKLEGIDNFFREAQVCEMDWVEGASKKADSTQTRRSPLSQDVMG